MSLSPENPALIEPDKAVAFLEEAARYFSNLPSNGEDQTHWANVFNADNCRKIARLITARTEGSRLSVPERPSSEWLLAQAARLSSAKDEDSVRALAWNLTVAFRRWTDEIAPPPTDGEVK